MDRPTKIPQPQFSSLPPDHRREKEQIEENLAELFALTSRLLYERPDGRYWQMPNTDGFYLTRPYDGPDSQEVTIPVRGGSVSIGEQIVEKGKEKPYVVQIFRLEKDGQDFEVRHGPQGITAFRNDKPLPRSQLEEGKTANEIHKLIAYVRNVAENEFQRRVEGKKKKGEPSRANTIMGAIRSTFRRLLK